VGNYLTYVPERCRRYGGVDPLCLPTVAPLAPSRMTKSAGTRPSLDQQSLTIKRDLGDRHGKGETLNKLSLIYR
jgi:hypothetical protein